MLELPIEITSHFPISIPDAIEVGRTVFSDLMNER
jgi:hypothetical protein